MHPKPIFALSLFLGLAAISSGGLALPAAAQQKGETQRYQCVAQEETGGYEAPDLTSPPARLPDEKPRVLNKDDTGYTDIAKGAPIPAWVELFGASEGQGRSSMGYFQSEFFKCDPATG